MSQIMLLDSFNFGQCLFHGVIVDNFGHQLAHFGQAIIFINTGTGGWIITLPKIYGNCQ
ncbi:hypothetical protein B7P43_G02998 [Cryptotermes secundus]|uniref:Uncharacterized protein n=1 Tax=Cryptotermes secundus TaxID=105785 RepID=A0A2J7PM57_9NEOP|nr:hypothetical protein B7P43_G02998 [Cryptotermes secundus]